MKRAILFSLVLLLCACGGSVVGGGPNEMAGAAQGRAQDTAQAKANADWSARQTQDYAAYAARSTAQAQSAQQTAIAAQTTYAADNAILAAMNASAQLTVDASRLNSRLIRATEASLPTEAYRSEMATATAYQSIASSEQTQRDLHTAARIILVCFLFAVCVIVSVFFYWVAGTGRRIMNAKAEAIEAATMQELVRETKDGQIIDMTSGRPELVGAPKRAGALPSGIARVPSLKAMSPEEGDPTDISTFITDAGMLQGWQSNQFPTADSMFERYKYSNGAWQGYVDQLKRAGWLLTRSTGTYLTRNRTLNDLYQWALTSPPPPPTAPQKGPGNAVERPEYAEHGQNAAYYVDANV